MSKRKIALVNQRYGLEVNGGSEYYTRLLAGVLQSDFEVEILTTTALDYTTWENYYEEGQQEVDGVKVRRFAINGQRRLFRFRLLSKILEYVKNPILERHWIYAQGPMAKDLIKYIRESKDDYDVFIFVTYLYYHTVIGLPEVADKAVLIPTAHDEPYIYFSIFKNIFTLPKAIIYLTEEEKSFVQKTFHNEDIQNEVIGIGVDVPQNVNAEHFRKKYGISGDYVIYVGRIDPEKGCKILFDYFKRFQEDNKEFDVRLILVGKEIMEIPNIPNIISVGFVSEEDKFNAIAGSLALILPSEYESLSISVLEAMSLSVPVIVNGKCAVLKGHCDKSKGGLYYYSYDDFEENMKFVLQKNNEIYQELKKSASIYVEKYYTWGNLIDKFIRVISRI